MISFDAIRLRAEKRKGGPAALNHLLPSKPDRNALAALPDDRVLAEMTKRVFSAGFAWRVIEAKWPGFEEALLGFEPARLAFEPDEFWEALTKDARIVRNGAKIFSVRANARFVRDVAKEHGKLRRLPRRAGRRPTRSGCSRFWRSAATASAGMTGQMLLRFLGWDGFSTSKDVVACLRDSGLDIAEEVKSKRDLETRPGAVQRLGERDRPALRPPLPHLRLFDRRELSGARGDSGRRGLTLPKA